MKLSKLLLLPALLLGLSAQAQTDKPAVPVFPLDSLTHKVSYTDVVPVAGATKAELYSRAKLWAARTFPSTDATVQLADEASGRLLVRGWSRVMVASMGMSVPMKMWFMVQVDAKDGRYRSIITDLEYQGEYSPSNKMMSAAAQTARNPAEPILNTSDPRAYNKKKEPRPIMSSYWAQTQAAIDGLRASLKAGLSSASASSQGKDW